MFLDFSRLNRLSLTRSSVRFHEWLPWICYFDENFCQNLVYFAGLGFEVEFHLTRAACYCFVFHVGFYWRPWESLIEVVYSLASCLECCSHSSLHRMLAFSVLSSASTLSSWVQTGHNRQEDFEQLYFGRTCFGQGFVCF